MGTTGDLIYHHYAPIYHAAGQATFGQALAAIILAQLPALPQRVLDLACGTGAATLTFAAAGASVVGIDRSPAMLAIARDQAAQRGLDVTWIEADIRHLAPVPPLHPASFDLITCLFDSLNYLTDDDDLATVCRLAGRLLRRGGQFIFDLNTLATFATWRETDQVVFDGRDLLLINRLDFDHEQQRASGRIVWFQRCGTRWYRGEETHIERPWPDEQIVAACQAGGLRLVARLNPNWTPADADAPRVVYVARAE